MIRDLALRILISLQDNTGPGQRTVRQGIQSISTQLGALRTQVLSILSLASGMAFGKAIFDTVVKLQAAMGILANVEGGLEAARGAMDFLRKTANELGRSFLELPKQYALFRAAVKEANYSVDESRRVFKNFMSGLSGLSATEEEASRVFTALRQMATNPKLALEELKTQMGEQLPGVMAIAFKAMGTAVKSYDDFLDKISKGKINSAEFIKVFSEAFAQKFPAITQGAAQALNRLENAWTEVKTAIGESGFVDALANAFERTARGLRDSSGGLQVFGENLGRVIDLIVANAPTVLKVLGALAGFSVGAGMGAAFGPLGSLVGGLAGAGAGLIGIGKALAGANPGSFQLAGTLEGLGKQYTELLRKTAELRKANEANPMRPFTQQLAQTEGHAKAVMARIKELSAVANASAKAPPAAPGPLLHPGGDTATPRGAKDDAYQLAKGGLDAQKAANRDLLQDQQETIRLSEAALKRQLDDGVISHQSYYTQLQTLREADLDAQIRAAEQEAAIIRQAQANLPADRGKAGAESVKLDEDLAAKLREVARLQAAKQEAITDVQAEAARADMGLIQQLDQLKLKLLELKNVRVPDILPTDQAEEFQLRVKILRAQYAKLIDELKAKGDEAGVALTERLINKEAWQQMGDEMSKFSEQAARNMQDAFANFLFDPFKRGTGDMLLNFSAMLRRLASESVASGVFDKLKGLFGGSQDSKGGLFDKLLGLFGSGGGDGGGSGFMDFLLGIINGIGGSFDTGGYTGNAGTATPAGIVHGQEFVFSAPATKALGVGTLSLLHALAGGKNLHAPRIGYALGGLVNLPPGAPPAAANSGQAAPPTRLTIINSIDPEMAREYLESPRGEQVMFNYISRNAQTIKRILA